jgi:hypothetical protein
VKKLISIGVALALLVMVVMPLGVGAAATQIVPATYAKIPFAIVQSGFYLIGCTLDTVATILDDMDVALPFDVGSLKGVMFNLGDWAGVPLAWSVDMMTAGMSLLNDVVGVLTDGGIIPDSVSWLGDLLDVVVTDIEMCYYPNTCNNVSSVYTVPCAP